MKTITFLLVIFLGCFSFAAFSQSVGNYNVTIKKMKFERDKYMVDVEYPYLSDMENDYIEFVLNSAIHQVIGEKIKETKKWADEVKEYNTHGSSFDLETKVLRKDEILSLRLDIMTYTGGAHPNTEFLCINYNLNNEQFYTFSDAFKMDDYSKEVIKTLINKELLKEGDMCLFKDYHFDDFQEFNLTPNGVLFTLNRIEGHACGDWDVTVSYEELQSVLKIKVD